MPFKVLPGDQIANVRINTTDGQFDLHDFQHQRWLVLWTVPKAFEALSTMELSTAAGYRRMFERRNVKFAAMNGNTNEENKLWSRDITSYMGWEDDEKLPFPIVSDHDRSLSDSLGSLVCRNRSVFIVDPKHTLQMVTCYPFVIGRCLKNLIQSIDGLQCVALD